MRTEELMAAEVLPIIKAREKLTSLPEELARRPGAVAVTRHGEPVLAIMSWELYESIVETLEILSDADLMAQLRQSIGDIASGKVTPWEVARRELLK